MIIVADRYISCLRQTFGQHGEIRAVDGRSITAGDIHNADALIVRSVTPVNETLLAAGHVKFVGTATIGTDHIDTRWLDQKGIAWASAPGCNADAAAQYTLGMMALACRRLGRDLQSQTVGIIGGGNVGSRLETLLDALGIETQINDPPLEAAGAKGLASIDQVLTHPVVSLHVPLTNSGQWPTSHLLGAQQFQRMNQGTLLLNAARGGVVDATALQRWLDAKQGFAALDTWPDEPRIDSRLLASCSVATPHVAGYSQRGRRAGSYRVYQQFCKHFGLPCVAQPNADPMETRAQPGARTAGPGDYILAAIPVGRDDRALRQIGDSHEDQKAQAFDRLRKDYPPRPEFADIRWAGPCPSKLQHQLLNLGFRS